MNIQPVPPNYNISREHQLITRENTYVLHRKLVTFHSEDRDVNKWPNANHFEIELPESLSNIQSTRLLEIGLPSNYHTFSNNYQNTKLTFTIRANNRMNSSLYLALVANIDNTYEIAIQEGFYSGKQLAKELENKMNNVVYQYLLNYTDPSGVSVTSPSYDHFKVYYDEVGQQMYIGNNYDEFTMNFSEKIEYTFPQVSDNSNFCEQSNIWNHYTKWGLPYNLGYNKEDYIGIDTSGNDTSGNIVFDYDDYTWLVPDASGLTPGQSAKAYYVKSSNSICIDGDSVIYMEMDKFDSIDELKPYPENTSAKYKNDYNGIVNSAFAKIPILNLPNNRYYDTRIDLQNISHYHPPLSKIKKLKFKFRYHDGRLVDFRNCNFNFMIEFNMLRDEIARDYRNVRTPGTYQL